MKKRAWSGFVRWVMVIWLFGVLSIGAASKSNGTTSVCEECLLDSGLPTISSSHFRRILAGNPLPPTLKTMDENITPFPSGRTGYQNNGAGAGSGSPQCTEIFKRQCHNVASSSSG